ncbi:MAG: hypothetical protein J6X55_11670 [Victivallales bacterium]|nr:hypothetical protein [Victivallales bacterium]
MKIQFLGTAAAEGWPALFCECEACRKARELGGKNIRRRCAYLLDDDTMVDYGPDIYWQSVEFGIRLEKIRRIFISHSHIDHLVPFELQWRRKGFSSARTPLKLFADQVALDKITTTPGMENPADYLVDLALVEPGNTVTDGDITAFAILADHAQPPEKPVNYVIQRGGVKALIGHDSGWWPEESWQMLQKFKIDILVLECTYGVRWPDQRLKHMGANVTVETRDELLKRGILKDDAIMVTTHFSHNTQNLHEELEEFFVPKGIQVAYDGLIVER